MGTVVLIILFISLLVISGVGITKRSAYLFSATGILYGLFLGLVLVDESGLFDSGDEQVRGAIYLLCMGIGFFGITMMTQLFSDEAQLWPVVPSVVFGSAGLIILVSR